MNSAGLAEAVTDYWSETYNTEQAEEADQRSGITIARIHRRIKRGLSSRSARAWLLRLGWNWREVKKTIYKDGHKRENVIGYRNDVLLLQLEFLKP